MAYVKLALVRGDHRKDEKEGLRWLSHAQAAIVRVGPRPRIEAEILRVHGNIDAKNRHLPQQIPAAQFLDNMRESPAMSFWTARDHNTQILHSGKRDATTVCLLPKSPIIRPMPRGLLENLYQKTIAL